MEQKNPSLECSIVAGSRSRRSTVASLSKDSIIDSLDSLDSVMRHRSVFVGLSRPADKPPVAIPQEPEVS